MATRFELVIDGDSPGFRALGEEALDEISRIEGMLSLYKPSGEVANLNGRAATEAVSVSVELFALLGRAVELSEETKGAFDITIAPLVRCWGFMAGNGSAPSEEEIAEARARVGFRLLELNNRTVRFSREGMMLDFGAFGKGYAVDRAIEILRDGGVKSALLHGGTSTVCGIGPVAWKIAVEDDEKNVLSVVDLKNESLSVSAVWGKSFASQGRTFGHVLDARTGKPVERATLAAVVVDSAADSDALSTALLVEGPAGLETIFTNRKKARAQVLVEKEIHARDFAQT
jgi:FAD:protein FMN transferase